MAKRLILVALTAVVPWIPVLAAEPVAAPQQPDAGDTWAYLKGSLPGAPSSCPDAQPAGSGQVKVVLFAPRSGTCPVASVGGDVLTIDDLNLALAGSHGAHGGAAKAGKQDPTAILGRLVDARLIVLEGRAMGLEELPDIATGIRGIEERAGREMLKERVLRDVRPDPAEVTRLFQDDVREWKLQSVLFPREADARAMVKQLKAGKSFDALAAQAVADKKAKGNEPGQFVDRSKLIDSVLAAVGKTAVRKTTPPVKVTGGYAVIEVEEVRYPENAKARAEAEQKSLAVQQKKALKAFYDGLVKKYARVDEKLLKKLDFESAKPGFAELRKDKRVLVRIEGRPSITVGELAARMEEQFYHGVENAAKMKKINRSKGSTLDALISAPLVAIEVDRQGIPRSDEFRRRVEAETNALVFGAFVRKVVLPGVKVDEPALRAYYDAHKADYSFPAFYKTESVGFAKQKDAEAAAAKLRAGTDFKWLNANADGKLPFGKDTEHPPPVVSAKAMTPNFAKAMDNAKTGDVRVYAATGDQFYAVKIGEVIPPSAQPYEEAREAILQKLYGEAVQKSVEDWIAKLQKVHPVQTYLTRIGS